MEKLEQEALPDSEGRKCLDIRELWKLIYNETVNNQNLFTLLNNFFYIIIEPRTMFIINR